MNSSITVQKTPCYLWFDSSGEHFKAYLTASFQTSDLSFRHEVTSVDLSLHVSPFALHSHWLARYFWILSLICFSHIRFSTDIGSLYISSLYLFRYIIMLFSTDKYLRKIRIWLLIIYLPWYLIQWYSTWNYLEKFEFEYIVWQPLKHVLCMCLRL